MKILYLSVLLLIFLDSNSQTVIKMKKQGGVSIIPCKVNGLGLSFIFDTGASDVSISLTEANFMLKNGYLELSDILGTAKYSTADGSLNEGIIIVIKNLEIAGLKMKNIKASIVKNLNAPLLLGQSAISKLGKIQLDLTENTLTILNGKGQYDYSNYDEPKYTIKNKEKDLTSIEVNSIINGINLYVKGFKIKDAYLIFEDGTKVPSDNKIGLSQQVNLRIILTTGFKEEDGKVYPGGTETIVLSSGEKILESDDLFAAYDITGVSPADAKYLTFKAVITEMKDKTKFITVSFRVWDKKSKANEITGSYKLYIK